MIKEGEIRIGSVFMHNENWSYRNDKEKSFIFQWESRDWYALCECTLSLENISPIELNDVNILSCDLVFNGFCYYKNWGTNGVFIVRFDPTYGKFFVKAGKGFNLIVESIHELQNAFYVFSLGGELKISL